MMSNPTNVNDNIDNNAEIILFVKIKIPYLTFYNLLF